MSAKLWTLSWLMGSSAVVAVHKRPLSRLCGPCVPVSGQGWQLWDFGGAGPRIGRQPFRPPRRSNPGHPGHLNPEEDRLLGPRFWALWGRSILVPGQRTDISKLQLSQTISQDGVLETQKSGRKSKKSAAFRWNAALL